MNSRAATFAQFSRSFRINAKRWSMTTFAAPQSEEHSSKRAPECSIPNLPIRCGARINFRDRLCVSFEIRGLWSIAILPGCVARRNAKAQASCTAIPIKEQSYPDFFQLSAGVGN
jgi:hypothetical protein